MDEIWKPVADDSAEAKQPDVSPPQLRQAVDQVMAYIVRDGEADAKRVDALIAEFGLIPQGWAGDAMRVYHTLNNGRRTRFNRCGKGRYRWRDGAELPPPIPVKDDPLPAEVRRLGGTDFENVIGGLLHATGFAKIQFTSRVSCKPDEGVDLRARLLLPLVGHLTAVVQVTGTRLTRRRVADLRGRCRLTQQGLVFAHDISPAVRELARDRTFGRPIRCFDADEVAAEVARVGRPVEELRLQGEQMRREQHAGN